MVRSLALAALVAATPCTAQFVSPKGFAAREGESYFDVKPTFPLHVLQTHGDVPGAATVRALAWRRDGWLARQSPSPGKVRVTLHIGPGDVRRKSTLLSANYTAAPARVFGPATINLPSWSAPPKARPAPFSLRLPFTRPWLKPTLAPAITWDLTSALLLRHADRVPYYAEGVGGGLGKPCRYARLSSWSSTTSAGATTIGWLGHAGPANQSGVLGVGFNDPNRSIPGLCGTLRTDAQLVVPITLNGVGHWHATLKTRWFAGFNVLTIYSQMLIVNRGFRPPLWQLSAASTLRVSAPRPVVAGYQLLINGRQPPSVFDGIGIVTRFE